MGGSCFGSALPGLFSENLFSRPNPYIYFFSYPNVGLGLWLAWAALAASALQSESHLKGLLLTIITSIHILMLVYLNNLQFIIVIQSITLHGRPALALHCHFCIR